MTNLSDLTRREQVLVYLRHYANQWVPGPDLANAAVGGSEGLKRLRELRQEGHDIRMRKHPDPSRDIWEYMLVEGGPAIVFEETTEINQPPSVPQHIEPAEKPVYPRPQPMGRPKMGEAIIQKEDGTYEYVPPQPEISQPLATIPKQPESFRFTQMPERLDFGSMAVCHRCKGKKLLERQTPSGKHLPADEFCRDPKDRKNACRRCNGFGIVPNLGPIPITLPEDQA